MVGEVKYNDELNLITINLCLRKFYIYNNVIFPIFL